MPKSLPGAYNVYVPNAQSSGNLFVDFSRAINDFKCLQYCQPVPTQQMTGIWYQMGLDQRARITDDDLARFMWGENTPRPEPNDLSEYFEEKSFKCTRFSFSDRLGKLTTEQAVWDEAERRRKSLAQQAMTARTIAILGVMGDSSQYPASHYADLSVNNSIPGVTGNWGASTSVRQSIKRTLNYIKKLILLDTRAAVKGHELTLVMGPETAELLSVTQEIVEMIKESTVGLKWIKADSDFPKENFGLPPQLYNMNWIVEETVKVTTQRGLLTQSAQFALPKGKVIVCHRPGELEGVEKGRSFSTCSIQIYRDDDMKVENNDSAWHRLTETAVTDNYDVTMTAPVTGFLLDNVVS